MGRSGLVGPGAGDAAPQWAPGQKKPPSEGWPGTLPDGGLPVDGSPVKCGIPFTQSSESFYLDDTPPKEAAIELKNTFRRFNSNGGGKLAVGRAASFPLPARGRPTVSLRRTNDAADEP